MPDVIITKGSLISAQTKLKIQNVAQALVRHQTDYWLLITVSA
jgi:hypothetical protein